MSADEPFAFGAFDAGMFSLLRSLSRPEPFALPDVAGSAPQSSTSPIAIPAAAAAAAAAATAAEHERLEGPSIQLLDAASADPSEFRRAAAHRAAAAAAAAEAPAVVLLNSVTLESMLRARAEAGAFADASAAFDVVAQAPSEVVRAVFFEFAVRIAGDPRDAAALLRASSPLVTLVYEDHSPVVGVAALFEGTLSLSVPDARVAVRARIKELSKCHRHQRFRVCIAVAGLGEVFSEPIKVFSKHSIVQAHRAGRAAPAAAARPSSPAADAPPSSRLVKRTADEAADDASPSSSTAAEVRELKRLVLAQSAQIAELIALLRARA